MDQQSANAMAIAGFLIVTAGLGLMGVLWQTVSRRTQEIGVRMAVGAQRRDIFRLVVGQGMLVAILGAIGGLAVTAAVGLVRRRSTLPFGPGLVLGATVVLVIAGQLGDGTLQWQ